MAEPKAAELQQAWAVALFRRSVLKQRKFAQIARSQGPTEGLRCLDLGSDNGVVSLLLRGRGGSWASGDLTEEAVGSIRSLVGEDVHLVRGDRLPFPDASFDRVAVVDMLEHVPDEAAFSRELARVTRPGGLLVVNTPHLKRTLLRRVREIYGSISTKSPAEAIARLVSSTKSGDYIAIHAYVQPTTATDIALQKLHPVLTSKTHLATTIGYGPRFLHSTGQLHKGDGGNGIFIQITTNPPTDVPIPDQAGDPASSITFGVLILAQALGDQEALLEQGRRVLRVHIKHNVPDTILALANEI